MRFVSAFLATGTLVGPEAKVTQVLSKDLPDFPGKEGLMVMVQYPQGSSDPYIATMQMLLFMSWN
jgi:hypothetical protein